MFTFFLFFSLLYFVLMLSTSADIIASVDDQLSMIARSFYHSAITFLTIGRRTLMAKVTRIELTPDDPIFRGGPQIFVPVSRPSTKSLQNVFWRYNITKNWCRSNTYSVSGQWHAFAFVTFHIMANEVGFVLYGYLRQSSFQLSRDMWVDYELQILLLTDRRIKLENTPLSAIV